MLLAAPWRTCALALLLTLATSALAVTYTVTPSAGDNGSISPNTKQTVNADGFVTFTATPATGYVVDQWTVNGTVETVADGSTTYTDGPVESNETLSVTFKKAPQGTGWIERWSIGLADTTAGEYVGRLASTDSQGNIYQVSTYKPTTGSDQIILKEYDMYGGPLMSKSFNVPLYSYPVGFLIDQMGDRFLLSQQPNSSTFQGTAVLQGWDSNWNVLVDQTLPIPNGANATALGLGTDSSNYLYVAESFNGTGYQCAYSKFSRTGDQLFQKTANFYSNTAQFDNAGHCSFLGYTLNNDGTAIAANAAVFEPSAGAIVYSLKLTDTVTTSYFFGEGNFDRGGNFYLATIVSTSKATDSTIQCFGPGFSPLCSTSVPGYAWYGAAISPYESYVYGSSDEFGYTGQFVAQDIYGLINWNQSTQGRSIHAFSARGRTAVLMDDQTGQATFTQWDSDTGLMASLDTINAPVGYADGDYYIGPNIDDCCCCDCCGGCGYVFSMTYATTPPEFAPTATLNLQNGDYLLAFRNGAELSTVSVPTPVNSGSTFAITLNANVPLTEGQIDSTLSAVNGTFGGASTGTASITAPSQHVNVSVTAASTNVAENMVITVKSQGVLRVAALHILPPAISTVQVGSTVTAATATTDAWSLALTGKAGTGGVAVTIASSNKTVIPNASATVPANGSTISGDLTVNSVTKSTTVTLTFTTSTGSTTTKTVTVSP
jgi:hypothetical protein